jgi:chromosome segregation ATPase
MEAILLDKLVSERSGQLAEYFDHPGDRVQRLDRTLDGYLDEIRDLNRTLTPPDDRGEGVEIGSGTIQDRRANLERLEGDLARIKKNSQTNESYAGVALLYYTISNNYLEEFESQIESIRETVQDVDLFEIQDLKGLFTKIESSFQSYERLYKFVEYDEDEALDTLHEFGDTAFDFRGQVATKTIDPDNKEALETLQSEAEDHSKTLRELNQKIEQFGKIDNKLSNTQEQLKREYGEFADQVLEDQV